jgi:hypothetical protein
MDSIIAVVAGSITAMGGLLVVATMMEQWMKRDPLAASSDVQPALQPALVAAEAD